MSDLKHTPAPWHYNPSISRDCNQLVYGPNGYLVANVGSLTMSISEQEADAKLIAASPDMLSCLLKVQAMFPILKIDPALKIYIDAALDKATK